MFELVPRTLIYELLFTNKFGFCYRRLRRVLEFENFTYLKKTIVSIYENTGNKLREFFHKIPTYRNAIFKGVVFWHG